MSTIQELLVGALRKSGHAVAILDRELKICWEGGMPRAMIGAPVNILWQGAKMARREAMKVLRCLASGNACQTTGQGKKGGERWRIDFIFESAIVKKYCLRPFKYPIMWIIRICNRYSV